MELKVENISKKFGRKVVLEDMSFSLENGVYGLLGENGAGKSTVLKIITGVLTSTSGRGQINGR